MDDSRASLGGIIKQQRLLETLTLKELATMAGISASHLGRIERGERYPSARILRKLAKPLVFEEGELFTLAGYLSPQLPAMAEASPGYGSGRVDPYVSRMLAQEPVAMQRSIVGILNILKTIAKGLNKESQ